MRILNLLTAIFFCLQAYSQEIKEIPIKTSVDEVTVFTESAQITRNKSVQLQAGTSVLKFVGLSPFIQSKSVQARVKGDITVLSVNHQQDFLENLDKPKELVELEDKLKSLSKQIISIETDKEVLEAEIEFLNANRDIGGNQAVSAANLKEATDFYSSRLASLKKRILDHSREISLLRQDAVELRSQINSITSVEDYANGEVLIKIKSDGATRVEIELTYVVSNAGWLPFYDIKAKDIDSPIAMIYKANVRQDTKVDWKNVKLRLSTANPDRSGVQRELRTYYLNYNTAPPSYDRNIDEVSGLVTDQNGEPLPGASVLIEGSTIGTQTDFDGRYSLTVPDRQGSLVFSYIGHETVIKPINRAVINVSMNESMAVLEEVVVARGYSTSPSRALAGSAKGVKIRGASTAIPISQIERQTTVDFEINLPYSVPSTNKTYAVDMVQYNMPANYKYVSIPKIASEAYLIASIVDWEKYNLLEGEANLFFENTYIGKTILDLRYATDTLQLSLGQDKNISIKREKKSDYSSKKFIGSRKEEVRNWKISVKNNKGQRIFLEIIDQIPVSTLDEISVELLERSRGKLDPETGEIKWELVMEPAESEELNLKYSIKYPKNRRLYIE